MERMKLETALNKNHTFLALSGMLYGYSTVAEVFADPLMKKFVIDMFYKEGKQTAVDPGIITPKEYPTPALP